MVIHQHVSKYVDIEALRHLADSIYKAGTILVVDEYIAALIAARQQMV